MIGNMNGFKGLVKQVNPNMKFIHCIIHRQALASKDLSVEFEKCDGHHNHCDQFRESERFKCTPLKTFCEENDAERETLLFHNTVRWL